MRNKRRLLIAALLVAVAGGVVWLVPKKEPPEPVFKGRPLSAWLEDMAAARRVGNIRDPGNDATNFLGAIQQAGPAAVPFIFKKLAENDSRWLNWYRVKWPVLPPWLKRRLTEPKPLKFSTTEAEAAVSLADGTNRAIFRPLVRATRSSNPAFREVAVRSLWPYVGHELTTNEAVTVFRRAVRDSDPMVRIGGMFDLDRLGPVATNAIPELIDALQGDETGRNKAQKQRVYVRSNAAKTLGDLGPAAGAAVPALTNLLATGDSNQRVQSAAALWHITSNATLALPALILEMPGLNDQTTWLPIKVFTEMGPQAKAAVPVLVGELMRPGVSTYTINSISNALTRIDPEAADRQFTNAP